jgi:hypothetical protein
MVKNQKMFDFSTQYSAKASLRAQYSIVPWPRSLKLIIFIGNSVFKKQLDREPILVLS